MKSAPRGLRRAAGVADLTRHDGVHVRQAATAHQRAPFARPPLRDSRSQIRLLRIRQSIHDHDPIQVTLEVFPRDQVRAQYVAISYTWGPTAPTRAIEVNGSVVHVRHNCWFTLWQMRRHRESRLYWIDSICIDQDCHREKELQVAQMGEIYSEASMVAVCIGDSDDKLDTQWVYSRAGIHNLLEHFFSREYFHRLWTAQESCLARYIRVFCGQHWIDWHHLAYGLYSPERVPMRSYDEAWKRLFRDCHSRFRPHTTLDISRAILQYGARGCYDPRDKIYGLLPLSSESVRRRIDVDYGKSLWNVMLDYAGAYERLVEAGPRRLTPDVGAELSSGDDPLTGSVQDMWKSIRLLGRAFAKSSAEFCADLVDALSSSGTMVGHTNSVRSSPGLAKLERPTTARVEVMIDGAHRIDTDAGDFLDADGQFTIDRLSTAGGVECHGQRIMERCACCESNIDLEIDGPADIKLPAIWENYWPSPTELDNGPVCILRGNQDQWQGRHAFQVPVGTRNGDLLLYCQASYPLIAERKRRIVMVCKKQAQSSGGLQILGEAIHLVGSWPCPVGFRTSGLWSDGFLCHLELPVDELLLAFLAAEPETNLLIPLIVMGLIPTSNLQQGPLPQRRINARNPKSRSVSIDGPHSRKNTRLRGSIQVEFETSPMTPEQIEIDEQFDSTSSQTNNLNGAQVMSDIPEGMHMHSIRDHYPEIQKLSTHDLLILLTGKTALPPNQAGITQRPDTPISD